MSDSYNYNDPEQWSNAAPDEDKGADYSGVKESVDGDDAEGDDVGYDTNDTNEQPTSSNADLPQPKDDADVAYGDDEYGDDDKNYDPADPFDNGEASDSEQADDALTPAQADEYESNDNVADGPGNLDAPEEVREFENPPFGAEPVHADPVPEANPNPSYEEREPINATFVETRDIPNESVDESVERVTDDRIDPVTGRLADQDDGASDSEQDEAPF